MTLQSIFIERDFQVTQTKKKTNTDIKIKPPHFLHSLVKLGDISVGPPIKV